MQQTALTLEDYIGESYVKCANIILGSRIFQSQQQKPPADRRSGRWFLLDVEELSGLTQRLEPWRRDVYAPLILEVSIRPWDTSTVMPHDSSSHPGVHTADAAAGGSMLLERWTLCFNQGVNSSSSGRASMDTAAVYKRLILLIRSLYSYVRVLPAYRMYRACKRHGGELFNTSYTLSTTADPSMQPMQPWPQQQQQRNTAHAGGPSSSSSSSGPQGGRLCHFAFSPVETLGGSFSIHVDYQPATTVHILEQTTIPVSMPRIIADYVDSPYARSAPHTADTVSKQTADRATSSRLSGPDGPLALLRSSQQYHTPLVRHSWSSKDVSGPAVVQKGFNSINSSSNTQQQQQQQHLVLSHHRTSSQGSFTGGPPMSPASGGQSPVLGAVGNSSSNSWGRPPLPHGAISQHNHHSSAAQPSAAPGAAGFSSSLPSVSSGYIPGSSGLPPASPVTPSGGVRSPLFRSSSLSAAAAIGAGSPAVPAAAAGQQQQQAVSRLGSTPPTMLQQVRHYQQYPKPPVQPLSPQSTQQGFHVKHAVPSDMQHSSSSGRAAAAAAGDTGEAGGQVAADNGSDSSTTSSSRQAVAAGSEGRPLIAGAHHDSNAAAGVGNAGNQPEQQQRQQQLGGQEAPLGIAGTAAAAAAAAADPAPVAESHSSSSGCNDAVASDSGRAVSAPLSIPTSKSRGVRARSVSDLVQMGAQVGPGDGGDGTGYSAVQQQQQQQGTVTSEWLQAQDGQVSGADPTAAAAAAVPGTGLAAVSTQRPLGGVSAGFAGISGCAGGMKGSSSSGGLLKVHQQHLQQQRQQQRQQQLVQAPSSAPAAPRGMLGQLLLANSGSTSPAFSPRGSVAPRGGTSRVVAAALAAAAAASGVVRDEGRSPTKHTHVVPAARGVEDTGAESDSSSSSGTSSAADGIISSTPTPRGAIIIRPNPLVHHVQQGSPAAAAAAAAGGVPATAGSSSPGGSRVLGRRALAGQGFAGPGAGVYPMGVIGVQPGTPGMAAPHSYMSSSPQLPFAFTPSGASLGTSLMSLAEAQRQLLPPGALGAANSSSSSGSNALKQLPAPLSRPGTAAAAAAAAGSADGGSGSTDASAAAAAGAGAGAGGSAAVPAAAGPNAVAAGVGAVAAVGTPSPPLLYAPIPTAAGQVSFIRDISGLATIRRPSWSSRSSSLDIAAAIGSSATLPHNYSMSPGMVELLDPSLMLGGYSSSHGSSAPGHALLRGAAGSGSSATGQGMPAGVQRWNPGQQQQQQGGASPGGQALQQGLMQQQGEGYQLGQGQQECGALASTAAAADGGGGGARCGMVPGDVAGTGAGDGGEVGPEGTSLQAGSDSAHCAASAGASSGTSAAASAAARAAAEEAFGCSVGHDESESDLLPFVLDAEPAGMQQQSHAFTTAAAGAPASGGYPGPGCWGPTGQQVSHLGPAGRAAAAAAGTAVPGASAAQKDAAVGAFLHMVQEAAAAPVVRLDRRQGLWSQRGAAAAAGDDAGARGGGGAKEGCAPVCVGDAVTQVQDLASQLQQLLFPDSSP